MNSRATGVDGPMAFGQKLDFLIDRLPLAMANSLNRDIAQLIWTHGGILNAEPIEHKASNVLLYHEEDSVHLFVRRRSYSTWPKYITEAFQTFALAWRHDTFGMKNSVSDDS